VPLHAGTLKVASVRFLLVDAFSSIVYATVYVSLGFICHNQLEQVVVFMQKVGVVAFWLLAIAVGAYVGWAVLNRNPKPPAHLSQSQLASGEPK
jgi:membrane protein DedA with SNARE-associated domain